MKGDGKDGERRTTDGGTGQRGLQGMKCDFGAWDGRAEGGNGERKGKKRRRRKERWKIAQSINRCTQRAATAAKLDTRCHATGCIQ